MVLAVVRHAESVENADKYNGFYRDRRPYSGSAAHDISRNVVGLTPYGFRQALWLARELADITGPRARVYASAYRRSIDTATVAFDALPADQIAKTGLLDEQHYGDATYMTKAELFAAYPEGIQDRRERKHLWLPPGGGESLAGGVAQRAGQFVALARADLEAGWHVIAVTHHTTILALRAILERRPITEVVAEARRSKTPNGCVLRYELAAGRFTPAGAARPPER
jgi:broad specificity phosphatase PhoE